MNDGGYKIVLPFNAYEYIFQVLKIVSFFFLLLWTEC